MRLTIVGCSGSVPGPEATSSCYLVEDDGFRLVLDLGAGAVGPLQRYAAPGDIDAVVISHCHADHWRDVLQLAYLRMRTGGGALTVIGPSVLPAELWSNPDDFTTSAATPAPMKLGPIPVRLSRVEHVDECWATRIGDVLCYTADTAPCPAIDELADGCRVLLAEASGLDGDGPIRGHLTAGDAARLAKRSGSALLVLTHLRPWQDHHALLAEAASIVDCPVILAQPGLRIAL